MKQNVLTLLQSATILLTLGVAMQPQGQPVQEHLISNNSTFTAAAKLGNFMSTSIGSVRRDDRAVTIAILIHPHP